MPWIYAIVGLLVGIVVGIIIARLTTPQYKSQKSLHKELQSTKFELDQLRHGLADHFVHSAEMLDTLGKEYTKLYQHMAQSSSDLLPNLPEQDNPFEKALAQHSQNKSELDGESEESLPPKDYASGATGLLRDEEKEFLDSSEVINGKAS
ncbi:MULTISPECIES: Z-ring associated protein ZapG [Vibrio]|uniref:Z-ring associated protein G n=2 Tax=Vibrio TaxID=662 RepID=A0A7X4LH31_9VIBR|nr:MULTISPECIES: Z-ring associated protein ZapG [Vibrio]MBF9001508.1 DUF1043 family protein [Vibrio nitrifigilis]MZI91818.1 DUF1043 family protein [Vibrio eleionomae]